MTQIVLNIPASDVSDLASYWHCLINLYNKSVIKIDIFMGLKYLAQQMHEEEFLHATVLSSYSKISEELAKLTKDTLLQFFEFLL